ncbi:MAG TPA: hypothetical protein VGI97_00350 [Gemmatimonadaceae bacterium]|jgi:hypothetical protein
MMVGHFGIAYGVRSLDKRQVDARVPLLWLLAAAVAPDLVDAIYALDKYCNPDGVLSHSIPAVMILAVLFGVGAYLHTRSVTTALFVTGMVMLHLPPDYITGLKALWAGGPVIGLYIYRWPWLDALVEIPVIIGGWWMLRRTECRPRIFVSGLALTAMLAVQVAMDMQGQVEGPRPARVCTR